MDNELIIFLENLLFKIKSETISSEDKEILKNFYLQYNFKNLSIDEKNLNKFLVYGWYLNQLFNQQ